MNDLTLLILFIACIATPIMFGRGLHIVLQRIDRKSKELSQQHGRR